jgi:hypothetical protein
MHKNQPFFLSKLQELTKPLIKFDDRGGLAGGSTTTEICLQVRGLDSFYKGGRRDSAKVQTKRLS